MQQQVLGMLGAIRLGGTTKYGSIIKISHVLTSSTLHSHGLN